MGVAGILLFEYSGVFADLAQVGNHRHLGSLPLAETQQSYYDQPSTRRRGTEAWSRSSSLSRLLCWTMQNVPRFGEARTRLAKGCPSVRRLYRRVRYHANSRVMVVAGLMLHEEDIWHLQQRLDGFLYRSLRALGRDHTKFELHATELWRGRKEWAAISGPQRHRILSGAYACLAGYRPVNPNFPMRLLGVALDRDSTGGKLRAYELVAKKFDDFVTRMSTKSGISQRGLILHDQGSRDVDQRLQVWISQWRTATSSLGRISNLADVPFFSDSRASRALQAADLVAYALYRYYVGSFDDQFTDRLWDLFDADQGKMHGLFHQCRDYRSCPCPACRNRH